MFREVTIREMATALGVDPAEIRMANHGLRSKGYGVCGNKQGMYKSASPEETIKQAERLLGMADKIREAAEGLIKAERQEPTELEAMVWNLLPEKPYTPEVYRTTFEPIEVRDE